MFKNASIQQILMNYYVSDTTLVMSKMMTSTSSLHLRTQNLMKEINKTKHKQYQQVQGATEALS